MLRFLLPLPSVEYEMVSVVRQTVLERFGTAS